MSAARGLDGKVALVTGSGRGIGAATARHLAELGASVAVTDVAIDGAQDVADEIVAAGGNAVAVALDCADASSIATAVDEAAARLGGLDLLDHNAGWTSFSSDVDAETVDLDVWQRVLDINVKGGLLAFRAALPHFRRRLLHNYRAALPRSAQIAAQRLTVHIHQHRAAHHLKLAKRQPPRHHHALRIRHPRQRRRHLRMVKRRRHRPPRRVHHHERRPLRPIVSIPEPPIRQPLRIAHTMKHQRSHVVAHKPFRTRIVRIRQLPLRARTQHAGQHQPNRRAAPKRSAPPQRHRYASIPTPPRGFCNRSSGSRFIIGSPSHSIAIVVTGESGALTGSPVICTRTSSCTNFTGCFVRRKYADFTFTSSPDSETSFPGQ